MTNRKITKTALVSSIIALFVCFTMIIGTSFAWFTDTVTSSGNIIQAGNLDAGFYWANGTEEPTTWNEVTSESSSAILSYTKWEPGYAEAKQLKVANNGSIAFNYTVTIKADVVGALADVIKVYVVTANEDDTTTKTSLGTLAAVMGTDIAVGTINPGEDADVWTLVFEMDTDAGDTYQGKTIEGISFVLKAVQPAMPAGN